MIDEIDMIDMISLCGGFGCDADPVLLERYVNHAHHTNHKNHSSRQLCWSSVLHYYVGVRCITVHQCGALISTSAVHYYALVQCITMHQ